MITPAGLWTARPRPTGHGLSMSHVLVCDGVDLGEVNWLSEIVHDPTARIVGGLNGAADGAPPRTWSWVRLARTFTVELNHNGIVHGEIIWHPELLDKTGWSTRVIAGLNVDLGRTFPCPEPRPPAARWIPGDLDVNDRNVA